MGIVVTVGVDGFGAVGGVAVATAEVVVVRRGWRPLVVFGEVPVGAVLPHATPMNATTIMPAARRTGNAVTGCTGS